MGGGGPIRGPLCPSPFLVQGSLIRLGLLCGEAFFSVRGFYRDSRVWCTCDELALGSVRLLFG